MGEHAMHADVPYNPTPRERALERILSAKSTGPHEQAVEYLDEAIAWALLDIADAIRELPERSR